jgi:hypothetical protein
MPDILAYGQEVTGRKIEPKDYAALREVGGKSKSYVTNRDSRF